MEGHVSPQPRGGGTLVPHGMGPAMSLDPRVESCSAVRTDEMCHRIRRNLANVVEHRKLDTKDTRTGFHLQKG